jgi:hypothetical protein
MSALDKEEFSRLRDALVLPRALRAGHGVMAGCT